MGPETVTEKFMEALETYENHKDAEQARLVCESELLRQEQDEEYMASLAIDQQLTAQMQQAPSNQTASQELSQVGSGEAEEGSKRAGEASEEEQLVKVRKLLADEFSSTIPTPMPKDDTAKLLLKFPNGVRVERTFRAEETFAQVRLWAACCQYLPEARERDLQVPAEFNITMAFPPRTFAPEEDTKNLKELGLAPNAALLIIRC